MSNAALAKLVERNMEGPAPDGITVVKYGDSRLAIRNRGCFLLDATLADPNSGQLRHIMYSGPDITVPKLRASHPMSPVGPSDGIGGQHGSPRWVDYRPAHKVEGGIAMKAKDNEEGRSFVKKFDLDTSSFTSITSITNTGDETIEGSVGTHDYHFLRGGVASGLKVNDKSLDELFGEGAEDAIMNDSETFTIPNFSVARVHFPEGYDVQIKASGRVDGAKVAADQVGMMVWHAAGTESLCFEPTLGRTDDEHNRGLIIKPNSRAWLDVEVSLV